MTREDLTRADFCHWISIEVRWGDMDYLGHVNNAVYFTYCESARISLFAAIGCYGRQAAEEGPSLVSATCDFKRQVIFPATLDVGVRVGEIGHRSFHMHYGLFDHGTDVVVASGSSIDAWTDYRANRAVPVPDYLRIELGRYRRLFDFTAPRNL
jgi:acyl-CoA thioester hydrolase